MKSLTRFMVLAFTFGLLAAPVAARAAAEPEWHMNATVIEACSCTMFCQCYFNPEPSDHSAHHVGAGHFCKANNVYKVNVGNYGAVKLDGVKWWVAMDLGARFDDGELDWAVVYFDKAATKEQRDAIGVIVSHLFPFKWKSLTTSEGEISWSHTGQEAVALLDGGKTAEVRLASKMKMNDPGKPVVLTNLKYWGAQKNDGFVLMPNIVEAYRAGGDKSFEFKGTNGFMITYDIKGGGAAPSGQ